MTFQHGDTVEVTGINASFRGKVGTIQKPGPNVCVVCIDGKNWMLLTDQLELVPPAPTTGVFSHIYTPGGALVDDLGGHWVKTPRRDARGWLVCDDCGRANEYAEPAADGSYICGECRALKEWQK